MKYKDILIQIRQIIRSVNLESKRLEKEHGISIPQLLCLIYLSEQPSFQAPHKGIKEFLKLNASTVTGIIARLEKKGYVARLPKQVDRRIGLITITAKGMELLERTPDPIHEQLSNRLKQLSGPELKDLEKAFHTITSFLKIDETDAAPIITAETNLPSEED